VTPHAYSLPLVTDANVWSVDGFVGINRAVVVPSPSWPKEFAPQQYAIPPDVTPQVASFPAATCVK